MIRRSPAELYIKALIVKGYEDKAIVDVLESLALDYPGVGYVSTLRVRFPVPRLLRLDKFRTHRETRNFLIKKKLYPFFEKGQDMQIAHDILDKPRAKEFIETMLISGAPEAPIAHRLAEIYRIRGCSVQAVKYYKRYFFDTELVDSTELRALTHLRLERMLASDNGETQQQGKAMKKASFQDPRRMAAALPRTPFSALVAQLQMGFLPSAIDLKKLAESSELLTYLRLNEVLAASPMEYDKRAVNLATTARILQDLKEAKTNPEEELRKQLQTIQLKTTPSALPTVHQLTGGSHTTDLIAEPKPVGESDDDSGDDNP